MTLDDLSNDSASNNKYIAEKDDFESILYLMKNLRLHNVIIHQNRFINKYARKKKAKISEARRFLVRYRRNYVLNNKETVCFVIDIKLELTKEKENVQNYYFLFITERAKVREISSWVGFVVVGLY